MITPPDRVRLIEDSLRCFVMGLIGLIPVLGFLAALDTLRLAHRVQRAVGTGWNPARRYLRIGRSLAWISVGATLAVGAAFVLILIANAQDIWG